MIWRLISATLALALAIACFRVAWYTDQNHEELEAGWQERQDRLVEGSGVIQSLKLHVDVGPTDYEVRYSYGPPGRESDFTGDTRHSLEQGKATRVGSTLTVYYDPADPAFVQVGPPASGTPTFRGMALGFYIASAVLLGIGLFLVLAARKASGKRLPAAQAKFRDEDPEAGS